MLVVSFLSLGIRAGLVVALSIPLVLAIVFMGMEYMQISLQRISLGALIIALGLLVDDAMITVEMMVSKIEEGYGEDQGGDLRLYVHRLSDADRHACHDLRLLADRLRREQYRAILFLAVCGHRDRA